MADYNDVAPAHNPPYIEAIQLFRKRAQDLPLVGLFELAFHRYVSGRITHLLDGPDKLRVVTCHLGGSESLCAVHNGRSVDTTMGFSPQCGILNATRIGTIDPFIIPFIMDREQMTIDQMRETLATKSGLLGISGVSGDIRDLEAAAAEGNDRARLALDAYCYGARKDIAAMAAAMGGIDALAFSGGIGEGGTRIRGRICFDLEFLGVRLDPDLNETGHAERRISAPNSAVDVFVVPTNGEQIVAAAVTEWLTERDT